MNAMIVHAHPEPLSFNAALRDAWVMTLSSMGVEVEVSDLYAQQFAAVASGHDFTRLSNPERLAYAHEQRHAQHERRYASDILAEQDKLARADLVIFQFPLWWYAPPAILKGWIDRVLSNGFAYADGKYFNDGLLKGKLAMLSTTTGGTLEELDADSTFTGSVDDFLRPITGGVLQFTGMTVLPTFVSHAPASMSAVRRKQEFRRLQNHAKMTVEPYVTRGTRQP